MTAGVSLEQLAEQQRDRGRTATRPEEIPYKGWWDVLWRVFKQLGQKNVSIVAAGLALFALLAIFPSLAAAVAIYGLFSSPEQIAAQVQLFGGVLPPAGLKILEDQLNELVSHRSTLSVGVVTGIIVALWSARQGMTALMTAMNVAYTEQERRSLVRRFFLSLAFTLGGVLGFIAMIVLGIAVPIVLNFFPLGSAANWLILGARWALLWFCAAMALSVVYRFGPSRTNAQWRWVTWGSSIAATLWIVSSLAFALYLHYFDSYSKVYGTLGGVVITLMWFYLSGYVIILGAEMNSEMERQTIKDTTEGNPKPIGQRGAYSADTVGPSAGEN